MKNSSAVPVESNDERDGDDAPKSGVRTAPTPAVSVRVTPRSYRVVNGVVEFIKVPQGLHAADR